MRRLDSLDECVGRALDLAGLVKNGEDRRAAVCALGLGRDRLVLDILPEPDDHLAGRHDARELRELRRHQDHFRGVVEDLGGLLARTRAGDDPAVLIGLRAHDVGEQETGDRCSLPVLARHRQVGARGAVRVVVDVEDEALLERQEPHGLAEQGPLRDFEVAVDKLDDTLAARRGHDLLRRYALPAPHG